MTDSLGQRIARKVWEVTSGWDLDVPHDREELARVIDAELARERDAWVSVKERLPEEDHPVLVAVMCETDDHSTGASVRWAESRSGTIYSSPQQIIATLDNGDEYEGEEILGWQELPAPPASGS